MIRINEGQRDPRVIPIVKREYSVKSRLLTTIAALCLCLSAIFITKPAHARLVMKSANLAAAADWPQWRGPARDGVSLERGLLKQWPAGGPKLLWQVNDIGDGY